MNAFLPVSAPANKHFIANINQSLCILLVANLATSSPFLFLFVYLRRCCLLLKHDGRRSGVVDFCGHRPCHVIQPVLLTFMTSVSHHILTIYAAKHCHKIREKDERAREKVDEGGKDR